MPISLYFLRNFAILMLDVRQLFLFLLPCAQPLFPLLFSHIYSYIVRLSTLLLRQQIKTSQIQTDSMHKTLHYPLYSSAFDRFPLYIVGFHSAFLCNTHERKKSQPTDLMLYNKQKPLLVSHCCHNVINAIIIACD